MRGAERHQDDQQRDESRSMTTQREGQGDWTGYVQPYRYYGPGYRGVGYYAVFYQGQDASDAPDSDQDEIGQEQSQFDQRDVQYGQGQGTGAGWRRGGRYGRSGWGQGSGWGARGRQSGQFAGRGPKGYQRSDERIREDVSDRLMEHGDLDASGIEVVVVQGVVTLSGYVDDRWGKRLAEYIAERVSGVRDVMNQLRVGGQMEQGGQTQQSGQTQQAGRTQGAQMDTSSSSDAGQQMTGTETTSGSKPQGRNGRRATASSAG